MVPENYHLIQQPFSFGNIKTDIRLKSVWTMALTALATSLAIPLLLLAIWCGKESSQFSNTALAACDSTLDLSEQLRLAGNNRVLVLPRVDDLWTSSSWFTLCKRSCSVMAVAAACPQDSGNLILQSLEHGLTCTMVCRVAVAAYMIFLITSTYTATPMPRTLLSP
jgi:hypothetical protein